MTLKANRHKDVSHNICVGGQGCDDLRHGYGNRHGAGQGRGAIIGHGHRKVIGPRIARGRRVGGQTTGCHGGRAMLGWGADAEREALPRIRVVRHYLAGPRRVLRCANSHRRRRGGSVGGRCHGEGSSHRTVLRHAHETWISARTGGLTPAGKRRAISGAGRQRHSLRDAGGVGVVGGGIRVVIRVAKTCPAGGSGVRAPGNRASAGYDYC